MVIVLPLDSPCINKATKGEMVEINLPLISKMNRSMLWRGIDERARRCVKNWLKERLKKEVNTFSDSLEQTSEYFLGVSCEQCYIDSWQNEFKEGIPSQILK